MRCARLSVRLAGSALDGSRLNLLPAKKSPHDGGLSGDWLRLVAFSPTNKRQFGQALRVNVEVNALTFADLDNVATKN